jgi:ASC-1-like (ASCH) protein
MVKKEVFEWIRSGQKTIELRRGRAREDDKTVFQCGRIILRGTIVRKEQGSLTDVLRQDNYKNIIPSANNLDEAIAYLNIKIREFKPRSKLSLDSC